MSWISGEVALALPDGEAQPRVTALTQLNRRQRHQSTAFLDLFLCSVCLATASALTHAD